MTKDEFKLKYNNLISLGVIKFKTLMGYDIIIIDRYDNDKGTFLVEKNDLIQPKHDVKMMGYDNHGVFGVYAYQKPIK